MTEPKKPINFFKILPPLAAYLNCCSNIWRIGCCTLFPMAATHSSNVASGPTVASRIGVWPSPAPAGLRPLMGRDHDGLARGVFWISGLFKVGHIVFPIRWGTPPQREFYPAEFYAWRQLTSMRGGPLQDQKLNVFPENDHLRRSTQANYQDVSRRFSKAVDTAA